MAGRAPEGRAAAGAAQVASRYPYRGSRRKNADRELERLHRDQVDAREIPSSTAVPMNALELFGYGSSSWATIEFSWQAQSCLGAVGRPCRATLDQTDYQSVLHRLHD